MNRIVFQVLPIEQPIGLFYLSKVWAKELMGSVDIVSRNINEDGVQRELSAQRVKEISDYCDDPDATFPTPIIISVYSESYIEFQKNTIIIEFDRTFGDVLDGQHRLRGIQQSVNIDSFELPVILMFDLTLEEKAYVFSTINSNQKKVDKSLIFDLFGVSTGRSPQRTVHEIARAMNTMESSPFCNRLKMLGRKAIDQPDATISQGTFSKRVLSLISKNENQDLVKCKKGITLEDDDKLPLRKYFIDNKDEVILKILLNCFNALKTVFPLEWTEPNNNILWKTTGFNAVIDSLKDLIPQGIIQKRLTQDFFIEVFLRLKTRLEQGGKDLTSDYFGSGESVTARLKKMILEPLSTDDKIDY